MTQHTPNPEVIPNVAVRNWMQSLPVSPYNVVYFKDEEQTTKKIEEEINFLDLMTTQRFFSKSVLRDTLAKKSRVVMFGAGGTASWFLPKLLKIYNDAFTKCPDLAYDLEIVVIDGDVV